MNARKELERILEYNNSKIVCADIQLDPYSVNHEVVSSKRLKLGYSEEEYNKFMESLDFEYDAGYGMQELSGIVWLENGWLERGEYDGSEWWAFKTRPEIPDFLH